MNAIEVENVWVHYDHQVVLENINLIIEEKSIVSIVGPNGSGKSTLLKSIIGLKKVSSGTISIFGKDMQTLPHNGIIGYLPQISEYDHRFPVSALDVVTMARASRKKFWQGMHVRDYEAIEEALELAEISSQKNHHFGSLSGGQKQRVLIARALCIEPRILIMDEPSTGLDTVAQDNFYKMLQKVRDVKNLTILMVSHDIGAVSQVVDKVACLQKKLHFHGHPHECSQHDSLSAIFGHNTLFVHHDAECKTCKEETC